MTTAPTPEAAALETAAAAVRGLGERVPEGGTRDPDAILDLFLDWVADLGFELYPAQEEALLEIMAGRHVILNTPTGSGKSLVAQGLHFKGLCEGRRSFYTSPIKALASEKFFSLCQDFGAQRVGMLTGDASINPDALLICCTAEVLANMALRQGELIDAPYVVMDEFHYYSDPERGVAWQIPLITLPRTRFLLMSATLGNTAPIAERLEADTGVEVATVGSDERPVPLEYEYRETPLHETVQDLLDSDRAPIYVVNFTQRECAELAQSLTSLKLCEREERDRIWEAVGDYRFDTPYGKDMKRYLGFGVGVHHAGLLPKYRLLVEQLSQQGLLKVICGTDTLGVGVNIPIRTVLFSKLAKYDGRKVGILTVREFKQISGRAGRKGFDDKGWVVVQAPEHVVERRKAAEGGKKKGGRKAPSKGEVSWTRETFEALVSRPPEMLKSRFQVSHGMVLNLLQRDAEIDDPGRGNFASLREIISRCHEVEGRKPRLLRRSAQLARSLYRAGVIQMVRDSRSAYRWVVVNEELQWDFSLLQALALYLVEALALLDRESPAYAPDLVGLVEAILEDPQVVLYRQVDRLKADLVARLKAEGVPYEERMERLDEVTHPKPNADFIYSTFDHFRQQHPWVGGETIRPKSIGREMFEGYMSFDQYVRLYGLQRSEGVLLRYLSQLYKTLGMSVPETAKTAEVYEIEGFFRTLIEHTDTSLLEEWESLLHPELLLQRAEERAAARRAFRVYELFHDPKAFAARVRAEMLQLVRALAAGDYEEAVSCVRPDPDDPWTPDRFEAALAPYREEYGEILFTPEARQAHRTVIEKTGERTWDVSQVLVDPAGDDLWALQGTIDFTVGTGFEGPLVRLRRIGT